MYEFSSGNFYIWSLIMQCNYNHGHNIFRHLMLYRIFLSPQVKRCAILSYKHGIYSLPHELSNDVTLRTLENQESV